MKWNKLTLLQQTKKQTKQNKTKKSCGEGDNHAKAPMRHTRDAPTN